MMDVRKLVILVFCLVITPHFYVSISHEIVLKSTIELLIGGIIYISSLTLMFWILEKLLK